MSEEIGIKFSNTFFPFLDSKKFSLFSGRESDKNIIIEHIKNGMIDGIHSYGEVDDFSRDHALMTINELKQNSCKLDIWIDHAQSKSNFCKYRIPGLGDIPGKNEYHFDLTKEYGIRFIWTERLTNIIGQGMPISFKSFLKIYDRNYPMYSIVNITKTLAKVLLDIFGHKKYNYFKDNKLINISTMTDGQKIYEFIRFNNYYKGPAKGDSFEELYYSISRRILNRLKMVEGYSIVYVHLGRNFHLESVNGRKTVNALRNLKQEHENGNISVDSTSQFLNYYINTTNLDWSYEKKNDQYLILVDAVDDPIFGRYIPSRKQLKNVTFYVHGKVKIYIGENEVKEIKHNPPDYTGIESITILD
ncbi:hypothetical protein ACFLRX_10215 [Acidobacteriota bacterium]